MDCCSCGTQRHKRNYRTQKSYPDQGQDPPLEAGSASRTVGFPLFLSPPASRIATDLVFVPAHLRPEVKQNIRNSKVLSDFGVRAGRPADLTGRGLAGRAGRWAGRPDSELLSALGPNNLFVSVHPKVSHIYIPRLGWIKLIKSHLIYMHSQAWLD